jgi:pimeloyl-ACP methyl ester carboxylesterase
MPFLDRGGIRIHYEVHGEPSGRPPMLLSHGFSASAQMWEGNLGALCRDRQVLTWDMRGHARSEAPVDADAYGVEQSVGDMLALLDLLEVPKAVLGGMSLGGYLSLAFHARHPDRVRALILVDTGPGFRRPGPRAQWNAQVERTAAALERDGLAALRRGPETANHPHPAGLINTARRVMAQRDAEVIESLEHVEVPTLVIVGAEDADFLRPAEYMAEHIPGARRIVLENAGHAANIDGADAWDAAVREFLEQL